MAAGLVTEYLRKLIAKQVEDHGLVVWYDPEGHYRAFAGDLALSGATCARFERSFFRLRHEIDALLNDLQPPHLVVYVPMDQARTDHALIELEAAGVVIQPGQQPPARNTRLSLVARNALRAALGEVRAADIEKQVEAGKLTLADLDRLGDQRGSGVVSLIFGTANPQDVALAFLVGPEKDAEIRSKSADGELRDLLRPAFEADLPDDAPPEALRDRLARHVLMTDLIAGLGGSVPPSLATVKIAATPAARDACVALARTWRLRRDLRDSYVAAACRVEQEFSLAQAGLDPAALADLETFPCIERALLRHAEDALLARATAEVLDLARSRRGRFWAEAMPSLLARWALIAAAAAVLLEAERVARALKKAPKSVPDLVSAYAEGDAPWCLLDTHHRHLERRWYDMESTRDEDQCTLDKLIIRARQRYTEVGSDLARHFVTQFSRAKHPIPGLPRQAQVFETQVRPLLGRGKVAYVWVDALRFEMARELVEVLKPDIDTTLQPALGTIPTITEIGMAALLPKADRGIRVVPVGPGKLALEVAGTVIKDRKDRIAFLKAHAGVPVFDAKLDDLLPRPNKRVRDGIAWADLVLITSQEIDELCEADNIAQARRQMDGVLKDLRRGLRVLSDLGVRTIVLAADHGHLFGEEVGEDMKIEAPGGEAADLHQRAWVGVGGTSEPSYLRTPLASLGVPSDLDFATPLTLACFRAKGGNRAYFHGGLSPQEVVIPVMVLTPVAGASDGAPTGIEWSLSTGSKKLSTRFFSVRVGGRGTGLFGLEPPTVRVEIRARGKCLSVPVSASYGFEEATGDVTLRPSEDDPKQIEPNTVTLMVTEEDFGQKTVGVSLLDATTGTELASLDKIEVAISL